MHGSRHLLGEKNNHKEAINPISPVIPDIVDSRHELAHYLYFWHFYSFMINMYYRKLQYNDSLMF
jgi:hypothetical protein